MNVTVDDLTVAIGDRCRIAAEMDGRRSGWPSQWMTAAVGDRRNRWPDDDDDDNLIASLPKADDIIRLSSSSSGRCNRCYDEKTFAPPAALTLCTV